MSAEFGDLFVGQQHELFDELVGLLLLLEIDAQGFAFGVEFELGLFALEAYGSALEACLRIRWARRLSVSTSSAKSPLPVSMICCASS